MINKIAVEFKKENPELLSGETARSRMDDNRGFVCSLFCLNDDGTYSDILANRLVGEALSAVHSSKSPLEAIEEFTELVYYRLPLDLLEEELSEMYSDTEATIPFYEGEQVERDVRQDNARNAQ